MTPYAWVPAVQERAVLASIPHTGTWLPEGVPARLASEEMRSLPMTDWHLHALYDFLPHLGVSVLHATVSRVVGDLNRSPQPLTLYPGRAETGVVPRETFWGDVIWRKPPSPEEEAAWIAAWHAPYHQRLAAELARLRTRFGRVVLLDLHSVASRASRIHDVLTDEIFLGNRDGRSCSAALMDVVEAAYRAHGFRIARNAPYKGGYITHHYGEWPGVEALQIEMVQRIYMDENDPAGAPTSKRFASARERLQKVFEAIIGALPS